MLDAQVPAGLDHHGQFLVEQPLQVPTGPGEGRAELVDDDHQVALVDRLHEPVEVEQQHLLAVGYNLGPAKDDGDFGPRTLSASLEVLGRAHPKGGMAEEQTGYRRFVIPALWMPDARMKRIHWHWTAGSYIASEVDKEHYHMVVEGDLDVIKGDHTIKDNEVLRGEGTYAAHTLSANTGAIGLSMCCMAGATETPFNAGKFPMMPEQLMQLVNLTAQLCERYKIKVSRTTTLSHAEVQPTLGIPQRGKWDFTRLPFEPSIVGAVAVGDYIRKLVTAELG